MKRCMYPRLYACTRGALLAAAAFEALAGRAAHVARVHQLS